MPWKLVAPRKGKTPYWYVRGKYLGISLDKSTGASERRAATTIFSTWKRQAERGEFIERPSALSDYFIGAAEAYMQAGGERTFLPRILEAWSTRMLADIDQVAVDALATELYPKATPATRNRQVYTPICAILRHVGVEKKIKRPKGGKGGRRTTWLAPEQTFELLKAACEVDMEFGILCVLLNYTGLRISEPLGEMLCERTELARSFSYIGLTKNGKPRAVYLPPIVVAALANHPRGMDRKGLVFRFREGREIRQMFIKACEIADVDLPKGTAFHVFRHNYGTWMRRFAGLDAIGLVRTGAWDDTDSVERYAHSEATEEAMQAINLPVPAENMLTWMGRGNKTKAG